MLDGPTPVRFLSSTASFRSPRGSFRIPGEIGRRESRERVRCSSWRWGGDSKGSFDFSSDYVGDTKVKITRVRRKGSFLRFSNNNTNSSLLVSLILH